MSVQAILFFSMKESMIDNAEEPYAVKMGIEVDAATKILDYNLKWGGLGFLICDAIAMATFGLGLCYRHSILAASQEGQDKVINDIRKSEKAKKEAEIRERHSIKKAEMQAKYP